MKSISNFLLCLLCIVICSCNGRRIKPEPLSSSQLYAEYDYDNVIEVPFKKQGGVRTIQVKINDCAEFPMIFDTGCSGMSISILELATLLKHGYPSTPSIIFLERYECCLKNFSRASDPSCRLTIILTLSLTWSSQVI